MGLWRQSVDGGTSTEFFRLFKKNGKIPVVTVEEGERKSGGDDNFLVMPDKVSN